MSLNSFNFILFLAAVYVLYTVFQRFNIKGRRILLLTAGLSFYFMCSKGFVALLIAETVWNYYIAQVLDNKKSGGILAFALVLNIGILFFFKYLGFFTGIETNIAVPAGISFFTLAVSGYLTDIYKGKSKAEKNFIDFSLFMVFVPALTSGPVERGDHLIPQLKEADIRKTADAGSFKVGLFRICRGFFLKLCVADNIKVLVDTVYSSPDKFAGVPVIIAVLAYSMQIYCDFAGYSDIAIGSARLFGIRLLENFDAPYLSRSIKDIWRRWHMSLSFWFRDYLYFPLGGSKKGTWRAYLNIMAVFAVSGLWHGADWKFIFWGVLNGMYQVTESIIEKGLGIGKNEKSGTWRIVLNYILMSLAWIFFRADTMGDAFRIISSIFGTGSQGILSAGSGAPALIVTAVFILVTAAYDVWNRKQDVADTICKTDALWFVCAAVIILVLVFGAYGTGYDSADFIYNRF